jgi:hypothetical protein
MKIHRPFEKVIGTAKRVVDGHAVQIITQVLATLMAWNDGRERHKELPESLLFRWINRCPGAQTYVMDRRPHTWTKYLWC